MTGHDIRLKDPRNGDTIRVIVCGDVVSLPDVGWSGAGYGHSISVEWLLHSARPPLPRKSRKILAECIVMALELAHTRDVL